MSQKSLHRYALMLVANAGSLSCMRFPSKTKASQHNPPLLNQLVTLVSVRIVTVAVNGSNEKFCRLSAC